MNHRGFCRTAPATPGPLKICEVHKNYISKYEEDMSKSLWEEKEEMIIRLGGYEEQMMRRCGGYEEETRSCCYRS